MLAIAMVLEGASRGDAAAAAGMDRQTLRDWVHRYNAAGIAGLSDGARSGRPPALTPGQMEELKDVVLAGPNPARDAWNDLMADPDRIRSITSRPWATVRT